MIITIDGPTASGKSSVGRMLAKKLGYYYLYSGLLYRALAYLLKHEYGYDEENLTNPGADDIAQVLDSKRFVYCYSDKNPEQVFFDGRDITPELKDRSVDRAASILSTNLAVREYLNELQRAIAKQVDVVVDGRDSGSVVFAHADYKFFLTASEQERAKRWREQQEKLGNSMTLEQAVEFIKERDSRDSHREHAPLRVPQGAHSIDNTGMTLQETLELIRKFLPS